MAKLTVKVLFVGGNVDVSSSCAEFTLDQLLRSFGDNIDGSKIRFDERGGATLADMVRYLRRTGYTILPEDLIPKRHHKKGYIHSFRPDDPTGEIKKYLKEGARGMGLMPDDHICYIASWDPNENRYEVLDINFPSKDEGTTMKWPPSEFNGIILVKK